MSQRFDDNNRRSVFNRLGKRRNTIPSNRDDTYGHATRSPYPSNDHHYTRSFRTGHYTNDQGSSYHNGGYDHQDNRPYYPGNLIITAPAQGGDRFVYSGSSSEQQLLTAPYYPTEEQQQPVVWTESQYPSQSITPIQLNPSYTNDIPMPTTTGYFNSPLSPATSSPSSARRDTYIPDYSRLRQAKKPRKNEAPPPEQPKKRRATTPTPSTPPPSLSPKAGVTKPVTQEEHCSSGESVISMDLDSDNLMLPDWGEDNDNEAKLQAIARNKQRQQEAEEEQRRLRQQQERRLQEKKQRQKEEEERKRKEQEEKRKEEELRQARWERFLRMEREEEERKKRENEARKQREGEERKQREEEERKQREEERKQREEMERKQRDEEERRRKVQEARARIEREQERERERLEKERQRAEEVRLKREQEEADRKRRELERQETERKQREQEQEAERRKQESERRRREREERHRAERERQAAEQKQREREQQEAAERQQREEERRKQLEEEQRRQEEAQLLQQQEEERIRQEQQAQQATAEVPIKQEPVVSAQQEPSDNEALPPGWEVHYSRSTSKSYFYNVTTGESTWERPRMETTEHPQPQQGPIAPETTPDPTFTQDSNTILPVQVKAEPLSHDADAQPPTQLKNIVTAIATPIPPTSAEVRATLGGEESSDLSPQTVPSNSIPGVAESRDPRIQAMKKIEQDKKEAEAQQSTRMSLIQHRPVPRTPRHSEASKNTNGYRYPPLEHRPKQGTPFRVGKKDSYVPNYRPSTSAVSRRRDQ